MKSIMYNQQVVTYITGNELKQVETPEYGPFTAIQAKRICMTTNHVTVSIMAGKISIRLALTDVSQEMADPLLLQRLLYFKGTEWHATAADVGAQGLQPSFDVIEVAPARKLYVALWAGNIKDYAVTDWTVWLQYDVVQLSQAEYLEMAYGV